MKTKKSGASGVNVCKTIHTHVSPSYQVHNFQMGIELTCGLRCPCSDISLSMHKIKDELLSGPMAEAR